MGVFAACRAALAFIAPAWRGSGLTIALGVLVWTAALSPLHEPLLVVAALCLSLVVSADLYRQACGGAARGLVGGVARLCAVWLLSLTFFSVLGLLVFVVLLASAYAVASAGPGFVSSQVSTWAPAIQGRGRLPLALVGFGGLAILGWAATRVALAPAATIARGRILVLATWPLTRHLGWRLLAARMVFAVPFASLAVLAIRAGRAPSATVEAWALAFAAGLLLTGVWLPLNVGLMSYIFERRAHGLPEIAASR